MSKINQKELHEAFQNLKERKQNAYNVLYEKYYKLVYGIVFSLIKNNDDSADVTNEIFMKIYKLDVEKLPVDHEASWLFTVSKNECMSFFRKAKPNISIEEIYEMPDDSDGIDDIIDKEYYNKLISGLKEDEKIIVSLKVLSNFTFKKISQVMNIPMGTVQWKYYNAIKTLRVSIGSLIGAVFAFIVVIARGEFWKEREYLENGKDKDETNIKNNDSDQSQTQDINKVEENDETNETNQNNNTQDQISTELSTNNSSEKADSIKQDASTFTETTCEDEFFNKIENRIDGIQISCLIIGIVLFAFFIIFFKKYQQRLKNKSSK